MPSELDQMRRNPGSVQRRELIAILRDARFEMVRTHGKHEVWAKGTTVIPVPRTLKATGTIRRIIEIIIAEQER